MEWIETLFFGDGVAHSILLLAVTCAIGIALGKIKFGGISLGVTWILFVGIALSHFGMRIDEHVLHFTKELGLILFVYSIGLQVGPSFFSSFKKGGVQLNLLAMGVVVLGVAVAYIIHVVTGTSLITMVGVLSGAVTNTPGLGAAQQAYIDATGETDPTIAMGYAVAYPLGVIGIITSLILLRKMFKVNFASEEAEIDRKNREVGGDASRITVVVENNFLEGKTVLALRRLLDKQLVISRILHQDGKIEIPVADTTLCLGDKLLIVSESTNADLISDFVGRRVDMDQNEWQELDHHMVSRLVTITKSKLNGKHLADLNLRNGFGVNITRIVRAGVELIPTPILELQMGDGLILVGNEKSIESVASLVGNSQRRLNEPNMITLFVGIFVGVFFGSIPFFIPGIPQPLKLGLAGGPLIISILISRFGSKVGLVTFTTQSANLMLREVGIALFLACVGLGAGEGFIETIVNGGYYWVLYGALITIIPLVVIGAIGRWGLKLNFFTLMGTLAGSMTDPPALAYANSSSNNDIPAIGYATVYPLTMFMRILTAQILILIAL